MSQSYAYNSGDIVNAVSKYGSVTAIPSTEIVIATYTAPVGSTPLIKGVFGEGATDGLFTLYLNSTAIWQARNAWTERFISCLLEKTLAAGDIVELKVTNQKNTNHTFTGGFYVYEL